MKGPFFPVKSRWPLFVLPAMTVAVVAMASLTAATPRPFRSARLWGGPTDTARLALRVEIVEVVEGPGGEVVERALSGERGLLRLRAGGFEARRAVELDADGAAELVVDVPRGPRPISASIQQADVELAQGVVELSAERWAGAARRRGGWFVGQAPPDLEVRVAPERGAFAVPFEEGLLVEVRRAGAGVAGARIVLSATGARLAPREAVTDALGRARFRLTPEEHALGVRMAVSEGENHAELSLGLPVVPGALRARMAEGALLIESPVPRDVAYFAIVSERERLFAGRVELVPDQRGSSARVSLPALLSAPSYAVVATERDLRSAAAIGWPLAGHPRGEPLRTFDAVDAVLLDGRAQRARQEHARRARVRWATVAFCALAVLLELALFLSLTRARARDLDAHLARSGLEGESARRLAPARSLGLLVAVAAVVLGFFLLAVAAVLRLR